MDFLTLVAKVRADKTEYDKGMKDAESTAYKVGQGIGTALNKTGHAIGATIGAISKATVVGVTAASTATAALVKSSITAYKDYEQLVGGVETLFGAQGKSIEEYAESVGKSVAEVEDEYGHLQTAQNTVMQNAADAYKTAGLSANEYMETVTSFAAALTSSLGGNTELAAIKADTAITDMADNANKMGSTMESIQNAYQGFAKQNYTMLDNLKLGYGGTKEEMQRLLEDAEKISGQKFDLSSYADIVDAIHVVQTEMGITGTTAKEATETIQGSLNMTKSAWQNLVTGLTDADADINGLIDNLVTSLVGYTDESGQHVKGLVDNIVPAISRALEGVVKLVQGAAPVIAKELPKLFDRVLPMLLNAGMTLFKGLVDALPDLMQTIFDQLPTIIESLVDMIITLLPMVIELGGKFLMSLADGIVQALPTLLPKIVDVVIQIVDMFTNPDGLKEFINAAVQIVLTLANALIQALPQLIPAIAEIILAIIEALTQPDNIIMLVEAAVQLTIAIAEGLLKAIPILLEAAIKLIEALITGILSMIGALLVAANDLIVGFIGGIVEAAKPLVDKGKEFVGNIIDGIKAMYNDIKKKGGELVDKVKAGFKEKVENARQWGKDLIQNFINGLLEKWEALKQTVANIANSIKDFLGFSEPKLGPLSNFHTYAPDMMDLFIKGIDDNKDKLTEAVANAFDFGNLITSPTASTEDTPKTIDNTSEVVRLLRQIASADKNVTIVLEGDTNRLFRAMQRESNRNYELTGQPSFT